MLKLNWQKVKVNTIIKKHSNTTLVKVKYATGSSQAQFEVNSNTTLVKVKFASIEVELEVEQEFKYNSC